MRNTFAKAQLTTYQKKTFQMELWKKDLGLSAKTRVLK